MSGPLLYAYSVLTPGALVRRYKRFLADVMTSDGIVTAFCPNSGSMMGLAEPGTRVYLSESDNPARRTRHTLELVQAATRSRLVAVNTLITNRMAEAAVNAGLLDKPLRARGLRVEAREVRFGESRLDLMCADGAGHRWYIEVKSVTLRIGREARFPDAVTTRGARHMRELAGAVRKGHRAAVVYMVQRPDCECFGPARGIDPAYAEALDYALSRGVRAAALMLSPTLRGITYRECLPLCP